MLVPLVSLVALVQSVSLANSQQLISQGGHMMRLLTFATVSLYGYTAHQPVPLHPYGIRSPIASAPNDKRGDITVDVTSLSIDSSEDRTGQDPPRILYACQSCRLLLALETLLERSELVEVA